VSIVNEVNSVGAFVKALFPTVDVVKQTVPTAPKANTFVVRVLHDQRSTETLSSMLVERDYQIVYFGSDTIDVLTKMDDLSRKVMNGTIMIPITGSLRYIRVEGFNFSQPFKTEGNVDACLGVLQTQVREARDQATFEKIMKVGVQIGNDNSTIDGTDPSSTDWTNQESIDFLFKL
jgi:hypothetical protein